MKLELEVIELRPDSPFLPTIAWIWGSTNTILPRNFFLSISSLPPSEDSNLGWISTTWPILTLNAYRSGT